MTSPYVPSVLDPFNHEHIEPTKIASTYQFTKNNSPKVNCHYHTNWPITHFCKINQMPLCQQCLSILQGESLSKGTPTNVDTLENCLSEAYQQMAARANLMVEEYEEVCEENEKMPSNVINNPIPIIQQARNTLLQMVNNYFDNMENIAREILKSVANPKRHEKLSQEVSKEWVDIMKFLEYLNTEDCLQELIYFYQGEYDRAGNDITKKVNDWLKEETKLDQNTPWVFYDQNNLRNLIYETQKYCSFVDGQSHTIYQPHDFSNDLDLIPVVNMPIAEPANQSYIKNQKTGLHSNTFKHTPFPYIMPVNPRAQTPQNQQYVPVVQPQQLYNQPQQYLPATQNIPRTIQASPPIIQPQQQAQPHYNYQQPLGQLQNRNKQIQNAAYIQ